MPKGKGGFVLARYNDAAKEWVALGAWALVPSAITYEPKINSRTVQGERTRDGERHDGGEADGGTETIVESQGDRGITVNSVEKFSRATRTGSSTCRVKGRCKRPRLLEVGDHRNV